NFPTTLSEYALFGDLTVHFTDRFNVQFGGRESWNRQVYNETDTGLLIPAVFPPGVQSPLVNATERAPGNAFTYLVTPAYKISPDLMVYTRFSSGYRVGGLNTNAALLGIPAAYAPDRAYDYELGIKGNAFDHLLTYDLSAYLINWQRLQIL